jgi:hypothetical protein
LTTVLYYEDVSLGRRMRRRLVRRAGVGFRAHPLLTLVLLAAVIALIATAAAVLLVLILLVAAIAAGCLLTYTAGRALLRSQFRVRAARRSIPQISVRAGAERYLASVNQFAQLLQAAAGLGIAVRPGDRRLRRTLKDAETLQTSLRELARYWRGPNAIGAGIYELEDAVIALALYLKQLTRDEDARPPAAVLRAQADALSRRLDAIVLRLRQTDFRTALEATRT